MTMHVFAYKADTGTISQIMRLPDDTDISHHQPPFGCKVLVVHTPISRSDLTRCTVDITTTPHSLKMVDDHD